MVSPRRGRPDVLIGGAAPDVLKRVMRAAIADAVADVYRIATGAT
jgi:hypothetical protein